MSNSACLETLWAVKKESVISGMKNETYILTAGAADEDMAPRPLIYDIFDF
tara:strand:- start:71 stop:223 length:153 start_codon:yes stop_codon:yes gene_type:complete